MGAECARATLAARGVAMTVDELILWLESIKRQNPDRPVCDYFVTVSDCEVDHADATVRII